MKREIVNEIKILSEEKNIANIIVKSQFYSSKMIIKESYCTNPKCNCREVTLKFSKFDENSEENELLFSIKLNIDTLEVVNKTQYDKSIEIDNIIGEFLTDVGIKMKDRFIENYKIIRGQDGKVLKQIGQEIKTRILMNECVFFNEVFDNVKNICFRDEENNLICITDQYCMNPACQCNETVITFVEIDEVNQKGQDICTLRYNLKNGKYTIENEFVNEEEMKSALKSFKTEEKEIKNELKKRYDEMKKVGKKINDENRITQVNEPKIGRNDICPCGSGKKYKKCCGKM